LADTLDGFAQQPESGPGRAADRDAPVPQERQPPIPQAPEGDSYTEPTGLEEPPFVPIRAARARQELHPALAADTPMKAASRPQGLASVWPALALAAILLVGGYFRLVGLNWDQYTHLHPDERFITMVETSIQLPRSVGEYFDTARSPLNPYNRGYNSFVYGTFPLFLMRWLGEMVGQAGYDQIHLLGRAVSGLLDLGSVLLIFLIGRRLYDTGTGLLGALLATGTVIQIQQAHFFTFDTFVAFFLLAAFFFTVRIWQEERWYDFLLMGGSLGLAAGSKINSVTFGLIVALVALKMMRDAAVKEGVDRGAEWSRIASRFAASALTCLLVFRIVEPYAFTGPSFFDFGISKKFLDDMGYVQKLVSGEIDQPPSIQWAGTVPYLFPMKNLILWGMGLPLGIVGWAGLAFAGYRLLARRDSSHFLIVTWVVFFFWYQGGQMAKTMRYFLPIVPLLALMGAHLLLQIEDAVGKRREGGAAPWTRFAGPALIALVAIPTWLYGYAFSQIYTRPITRIEATEWIFANIPQGTPIANEHWDDPLPLRWQGRDAGWYRGDGLIMEVYNDDTPEKRAKLEDQLDRTQYIFISSDRASGAIPRMPMRYPLTAEYYRLLFSGQLGFKLVKSFTSYPTLFGFQLNDDAAEEIFRNYEHPKVLIYQKTPDYSSQKVRELLGAVPLDNVLRIKPTEVGYNGLLLSDADRAVQQAGGTWSSLYDPEGVANRFPTFFWWLALELLGFLALPLAWRVFARFPDHGCGLSKILGLLVTAYVAWLLPSLHLLPFGPPSILVGMAVLALLSIGLVWRQASRFLAFVRQHRTLLAVYELVFLVAFALFWMIRVRNPDLWHLAYGGEKPMEFAYLNAVAKSTYFPPYDPWMAGGYMNYYYFSFVLVATLIRLTGIVPAVAFNLAIPSIFGLTAAGLFSFGFNYSTRVHRLPARALPKWPLAVGVATAVFVLIAGNLDGPIQILEALWKLGGLQIKSTIPLLEGAAKAAAGLWMVLSGGKVLPPFDFWRSTRIVGSLESPTPIMEFPYFTFLYGDLHPHMIAMPLATLALALVLAIVWQGTRHQAQGDAEAQGCGDSVNPEPRIEKPALSAKHSVMNTERVLTVIIGGLVVGALQATNSWDYPTYLLLLSAAFLLAGVVRNRDLTWSAIADALLSAGATFLVAQLLFLPFTRAYELFYNGVDPAPARTRIEHYLVMFGFFLFCIGSVLLASVAGNRWHRFWWRDIWERLSRAPGAARRHHLSLLLTRPSPWMELPPPVAMGLLGIAAAAALLRLYLIALLVLLGLLALLTLFDRERSPERMLMALFAGLGVALTLGVEFVTIKGDIGRMNTVFKFYLQAWFLFGVASAVGVAGLLLGGRARAGRPTPWWRLPWAALLGLIFLSVLIYPVSATPVKVGARFNQLPPTLDGMAYMQSATFKDQNQEIVLNRDYQAIKWLQGHVVGSPVVLEAQIPEYRWGSRISIYTGLPTVLGWTWHQRQQRSGYQYMIEQRLQDIKMAFDTTDAMQLMTILRRYDVSLIYVGDLERAYYSPAGLAKFDALVGHGLTVAYRADGVTIYQVNRDGRPGVVRQ